MAVDSRTVSTAAGFFAEPSTQFAMRYVALCLLALYLSSIYWVIRDAEQRIATPLIAYALGSLALVPYFGVLAYLILRPRDTLVEARIAERWRAVHLSGTATRQGRRPSPHAADRRHVRAA